MSQSAIANSQGVVSQDPNARNTRDAYHRFIVSLGGNSPPCLQGGAGPACWQAGVGRKLVGIQHKKSPAVIGRAFPLLFFYQSFRNRAFVLFPFSLTTRRRYAPDFSSDKSSCTVPCVAVRFMTRLPLRLNT